MQQSTPYLSFRGIGKTFPGVKALTDISFDCYAGQVHALMGENGAGKSTLLKILSGNYAPTTGSVVINGQEMSFSDTTAALNAGVAIIYQELHLVPEMTVAENIYLGQLPHKGGIVNRSLLNYEAGLQLKHLGMDIDPDTPLKYLSIGQWQMVEIAKALARNAKIIAFDEPTSSLSAREIDNLFRVIRELRKEGRVILYVSHRMEEIFALSDAITVFKDGRYVKTFTDMQQVDHDALVQAMVGRDIGDIYPGTYVRPHRHPHTFELLLPLRGRFVVLNFDDRGTVTHRAILGETCTVLEMAAGTWHAVLSLDTGGIIFEVKHGGYQPVAADDYAHWAPAEGEPGTTELMAWYAQAQVGDSTFAV